MILASARTFMQETTILILNSMSTRKLWHATVTSAMKGQCPKAPPYFMWDDTDIRVWDLVQQLYNLIPRSYSHGTAMAGLVAAAANNSICSVGIAPGVTLGSVKLIADIVKGKKYFLTDAAWAKALTFNIDNSDICVVGVGPPDRGECSGWHFTQGGSKVGSSRQEMLWRAKTSWRLRRSWTVPPRAGTPRASSTSIHLEMVEETR